MIARDQCIYLTLPTGLQAIEPPPLALEDGQAHPTEVAAWSGATCREVFNKEAPMFALGMCRDCYNVYIKSSGGIWTNAADPPAYTRNLRK